MAMNIMDFNISPPMFPSLGLPLQQSTLQGTPKYKRGIIECKIADCSIGGSDKTGFVTKLYDFMCCFN